MTEMKVEVNKDALGFPSIVNITRAGKTLRVTTNPDQGFTIEGPRDMLPSPMEAFRVILPRVSYQKEVDVIQAEENTEVTTQFDTYQLLKVLGINLSASKTVLDLIATLKTDVAGTAWLKVTYQVEGASELTWLETSTTQLTYQVIRASLEISIKQNVTIRAYAKNPAAGTEKAYNKQLTLLGDKITLVGHLF